MKRVIHFLVELAGIGSIVAGAWLYDVRVGLIVLGAFCLKATTTGGLRLSKRG